MEITVNKVEYQISAFDNIADCRAFWPDYHPHHLFIGYDFLEAAAKYTPENISSYYTIVSDELGPFGFFAYEVNAINMYKSLEYNLSRTQHGWFNKINNFIRGFIARRVNFNALVNGNSLATGEYAYCLKAEYENQIVDLLAACNEHMLKFLDKKGIRCVGVYSKDFFKETYDQLVELESNYNYTHYKVQPNMIFNLDPSWLKSEDYSRALSSKYRVRNKRARKKATGLTKKELSLEEIAQYGPVIYEAYECIATQVDFNLFILHPDYFFGLKEKFGETFKLVAYFKEEELLGYYTYFICDKLIEAHFLGCFPGPNRQFHIYHNFLLDLVEVSILHQKSELILSRTALEIKSSIGATPYDMYGFIKHRKKWGQWLTPRIFNNLNPSHDWVQRNPFKQDYPNS